MTYIGKHIIKASLSKCAQAARNSGEALLSLKNKTNFIINDFDQIKPKVTPECHDAPQMTFRSKIKGTLKFIHQVFIGNIVYSKNIKKILKAICIDRNAKINRKDPLPQIIFIQNIRKRNIVKTEDLGKINLIKRYSFEKEVGTIKKITLDDDSNIYSIIANNKSLGIIHVKNDFIKYLVDVWGRNEYKSIEKKLFQICIEDFMSKGTIPEFKAAALKIGNIKGNRAKIYENMGAIVKEEKEAVLKDVSCPEGNIIQMLNALKSKDNFILPNSLKHYKTYMGEKRKEPLSQVFCQ